MLYKALSIVKEKLDENKFDLSIRLLAAKEYYVSLQALRHKIEKSINNTHGALKTLCSLFLLGQTIDSCELNSIFKNDEISVLANSKFLQFNKNKVRSNFIVFPFLGCYFVIDRNFSISKDIYIGEDSYLLAQLLQTIEFSNVLDLCTGIGLQAIVSGKKAKKCIAIDINRPALMHAYANVKLNKLEHKVHLLRGDLFEPLSRERFDLICANPPLIPVPYEIPYPLYGHGGPDGLQVVRRILNKVDEHLENDGKVILLSCGMHFPSGINIIEELKNKFKQMHWDITIFILDANPVEIEAERLSSIISKLYGCDRKRVHRKYMEHFRTLNTDYILYCVLFIIKELDQKFQMRVVESPRATIYKRPYLRKMVKILKKTETYYHVAINDELFEVDNYSYLILRECNGKKARAHP
jgi:HemK-related putative methylase